MVMNLANFHFAHPLWLWAIFIIPLGFIWSWYWQFKSKKNQNILAKFIDEKLLPHLLISTTKERRRKRLGVVYAILIAGLVISLANPRWDYIDIDAYTPTASMVVLLDLSSTMNATDVAPSRIVRARQSIEDLLNLSKGLKIGLLGFAANPHLISPITDDVQTIKGFLPAVDTDLVSKQGCALSPALKLAKNLLDSEPGEKKSILLVGDGNFMDEDYTQILKEIAAENIGVYVMGIGTPAGAPFKDQTGALARNKDNLAISKLNQTKLREIAKIGNGIYVEANHSETGIQAILNKAEQTDSSKQVVSGKIRQWEDRYYLLLLPAAICLLYLMSQRVFYSLFFVVFVGALTTTEVQAYELSSIFLNADQKGAQEFAQNNFSEAADIFSDPYKKGVALYKSGNFAAAEEQFNKVKRSAVKTAAKYNAGNAQMQQKKWQAAIENYEQVLELEAENLDAKFNLALAKKMLAENEQKDSEQQQSEQDNDKQNQDQQNQNQVA